MAATTSFSSARSRPIPTTGRNRCCLPAAASESSPPATANSAALFAVAGGELSEAAAGKQQRFLPVVGIGLDRAEENDVVAAIIAIHGAALELRHAAGDDGSIAEPRLPFHPGKLFT